MKLNLVVNVKNLRLRLAIYFFEILNALQLETVEHKLRIAIRKNKVDKIPKLEAKVSELKKALAFEWTSSESESDKHPKRFKKTETGISFSIPNRGIQV